MGVVSGCDCDASPCLSAKPAQRRQRGAQLGDALAGLRRWSRSISGWAATCLRRFRADLGEARAELAGVELVDLGQHDLVGDRGLVEQLHHLAVGGLEAVARSRPAAARGAGSAGREIVLDQPGPALHLRLATRCA